MTRSSHPAAPTAARRRLALSSCLLSTAILALAGCASFSSNATENVTKAPFGTTADKRSVDAYTLINARGTQAVVITYGATLTQLRVAGPDGKSRDIVLGFDDLASYEEKSPYFGCTVGRYCNRIAKGKFELDGKSYQLATNNNQHHLHGGDQGFDKRVWRAEIQQDSRGPSVRFSYRSVDGEENYPGNLDASVTYTLTDADDLVLEYVARTDAPTLCNLTHHSYFNLGGEGSGTILDHELRIDAARYTPGDETLIPTGAIDAVADTPFDFTTATPIGRRIDSVEGGYDVNYVLPDDADGLRFAARVQDPDSGQTLEVWTTEPGLQFYSGNFLDGSLTGKSGTTYVKHGAFCLEPQKFPDSINQPSWPSPILRPGQTYRQVTLYRLRETPTQPDQQQ